MARTTEVLRALVVGRPRATDRADPKPLTKYSGIGRLASNNLSSSAYATEEMLLVLAAGGAAALAYSTPATLGIVGVVALVAFSYAQTARAYPQGGGAYTVAHQRLGEHPGLVAGSALLVDYVLTVAVSVSAGVGALVSISPGLHPHRVVLALAAIWLLTLVNLRGVRHSTLLSLPTYAFLLLAAGTVLAGLIRAASGDLTPAQPAPVATADVSLALVLTAFARGSVAATGLEPMAGASGSFREPSSRNAATTLLVSASLLVFLVGGMSFLARAFGVFEPTETRTVLGHLAHAVWGDGLLPAAVLASTALVLLMAANTAYADFPRLGAMLARDRYWPRQFMNRGDRLAHSNGILGLAVLASVLVVTFGASPTRLISLYVIGAFAALTLNQAGMVRHWRERRSTEPRWRLYGALNAIGATAAAAVGLIVLMTRLAAGGWLVVVTILLLVLLMKKINKHYTEVRIQLRDPDRAPSRNRSNHVVLLVGSPTSTEARAFLYADRIRTDDFHAVHVAEPKDTKGLEARWARQLGLLPTSPALEVVAPSGGLSATIRSYVDRLRARIDDKDFVTVIVSEQVREGVLPTLGTSRSLRIKTSLLFTPGIVVTDVPYIGSADRPPHETGRPARHVVVLLVAAAHNATLHALEYAKTLHSDEIRAVHVALDPDMTAHHCQEWDWLETGYELEVVPAPYRRLGQTLRDHVRSIVRDQEATVTVVLAEFLVRKWWHHLLHNQNALDLKATFLAEPNVVVTSVPYRLQR